MNKNCFLSLIRQQHVKYEKNIGRFPDRNMQLTNSLYSLLRFKIWECQGDAGWRNVAWEQMQESKGVRVMLDGMAAGRKVP